VSTTTSFGGRREQSYRDWKDKSTHLLETHLSSLYLSFAFLITSDASSECLVLGKVILQALILNADDHTTNNGNYSQNDHNSCNDYDNDWTISIIVISSFWVTETVILDLAGRCVDTINCELVVSVVENGIELLHKDIAQDVLIRVELIALDANLANYLTILVCG
jgi:hypothetical protein